MGQNDIFFVEIMAVLGVIGVLAFLIVLISQVKPKMSRDNKGNALPGGQQSYGFFLAAIVLAVATVLFLWRFPPSHMAQIADVDWQLDARSMTFFVIMLLILALAILIFIVYVFTSQARQNAERSATGSTFETPISAKPKSDIPTASYDNPSGIALLGLLVLAIAYAVLNWSYMSPSEQFSMMLRLVYPAGFVIVLVMMFDKATRAWNIKAPGEALREWLFCNTITFLFLLAYLNLLKSGGGKVYGAMIVDLIGILVFLTIIWVLDRKVARLRFLIAYGYLVLLPIAVLIWRRMQGVEIPEDIAWWETIWPFFFLAIIFFVLEIIFLIVTRDTRSQGIAIAKDILFLVLYVIFLIIALPEVPVA